MPGNPRAASRLAAGKKRNVDGHFRSVTGTGKCSGESTELGTKIFLGLM